MFSECRLPHVHVFPFLFVQIVEARDALLQKIRDKKDVQVEERQELRTPNTFQEQREDSVIERESIPSEKNQILNEKSNASKGQEIDDTVSTEKWLQDTNIDIALLTFCI